MVETAEPANAYEFSAAVAKAWKGIEGSSRKAQIESLRSQRQASLVTAMSNVRTSRTLLEYKENALEDLGPAIDPRERQAREAEILHARLGVEANLQECDALAEELEALADALQEIGEAGAGPMIGAQNRTTRRRRK